MRRGAAPPATHCLLLTFFYTDCHNCALLIRDNLHWSVREQQQYSTAIIQHALKRHRRIHPQISQSDRQADSFSFPPPLYLLWFTTKLVDTSDHQLYHLYTHTIHLLIIFSSSFCLYVTSVLLERTDQTGRHSVKRLFPHISFFSSLSFKKVNLFLFLEIEKKTV